MDWEIQCVHQKVDPKLNRGYYLLVCTTCTHQSGHRCPDRFGILQLRCFDVYGSQIGSTESGNPVWTYENRCRPIWAPSYGSSIGRQRA